MTAPVEVDVAVIGGGITGLTTALLLQRAGARVAVLEAGRLSGGTTGATTGKVTSQHGLIYGELTKSKGAHVARLYGEANQQAIETIAGLADEFGDAVGFARAPAYVYATDGNQAQALREECEAALAAGLPATYTTTTNLPFDVEGALRFENQAYFHPTEYCHALATAVIGPGGRIFENTRALDVDEVDGRATVHTAGGDITAGKVVVATLLPFLDHGLFYAKSHASRAYGVAVVLEAEPPAGMYISAGTPVRSTRPWLVDGSGGGHGLVVVGENHRTGESDATPARWGALERWTREHFSVASFEYRWSAQDYITIDGLPYVGRSPRMRDTYVATGFRKWGLTNGTAAALVLAEIVQGRAHPWAGLYDATRIGGVHAATPFVRDNLRVAKHFVGDRVARLRPESVADLSPGEAKIVKVGGKAVGAYRDPEGDLHCVGLSCSHLGCTVQWNHAEKSWDCPCHGSRFSTEGAVLNGPAVKPLERVTAEDSDDSDSGPADSGARHQ